jgi:hypothetical protein
VFWYVQGEASIGGEGGGAGEGVGAVGGPELEGEGGILRMQTALEGDFAREGDRAEIELDNPPKVARPMDALPLIGIVPGA